MEHEHHSPLTQQGHGPEPMVPASNVLSDSVPRGQLPTGTELEDLVRLYFSSVHHFGFFAFIHQFHFNRLLAKGKAPRELTLMMIASAMRFAAKPTPENLARADAWASTAIESLLPRIYKGFGVVQLMALLLAQHYDLNRGNFTSAWLLGANCTRMMQMMSLQTFDRTYPTKFASNLRLSPLLSCEALRRVAWSTFYVDTIVDGGRYGFHIVDEKAYRLQLPCDQASFLADETVITEPLFYNPTNANADNPERAPLDMSAYLLRTAAARRRALHFAFRASHSEQTVERLMEELAAIEADVEEVITALPKRFHFNTDNMFLHRDRLITFILLHILRHNLFIVIGRAALQIYQRDSAKSELIAGVRRNRISHALPIAGLISEGLKADISFDPQVGVQAYVALEILLFEPRRLAETDPFVDPKAPELMEAIPHLLTVVRNIADRSEFVKQLHIEAVLRLLRCDFAHLLNQIDFVAFRSEYRLVGQDAAEYDFRDFRWAKLERIRQGAESSTNAACDEALLEYKVGEETAPPSTAPSPRLDAMDVRHAIRGPSVAHSLPYSASNALNLSEAQSEGAGVAQTAQPWWGLAQSENADQAFSLDYSWLLDESGLPWDQADDLTRSLSQF
ncbi:uncharacterized protein Z519_06645 [Cladophialophora bantiana CBS 173.52]|uniref:Xylanolytic transcriptional activator regulatory domain-containing protein n=1 Tax=Cladophialophora bantiana (strain ATCC 10958 / CBS 173.52 / CDC B-1940 / NIH 8579) TaxID=1442370 RepID=A0A0D2ESD6_CLAB1|nr:uncharacterized protein Z519_06645 [Cladophialophora bantiana CBS 173.52]KIW92796.1 hypothetical protein Z519_06645 [Cladophialophora bantiana CBS 173.52]